MPGLPEKAEGKSFEDFRLQRRKMPKSESRSSPDNRSPMRELPQAFQKCAGILKAKNSLNDKLDATFRKKLADQQRGKLMINNGKKAMWINSYELDAFLLTGWKKGMLKREHTKI